MKIKTLVIYVVFILLGFLISFKTLFSPYIAGDMDAYARANAGFDKYISSQLLNLNPTGDSWLPLHASILGFAIWLFRDPLLAPRALTLIFSVLSIPLIFIYTKNIFLEDLKKN